VHGEVLVPLFTTVIVAVSLYRYTFGVDSTVAVVTFVLATMVRAVLIVAPVDATVAIENALVIPVTVDALATAAYTTFPFTFGTLTV
jgi:hypothetical protein